ncbi:MAG: ATP phosphoribosyltransferase, partial [Pseudomonadaceae bacterium]|nr:ATP phosphoribosyltransferase [Pseudomonadaceae bacterium]
GKTLVANGLEAREFIADISSRLVVNRASMKMKYQQIQPLLDRLRLAVEQRSAASA